MNTLIDLLQTTGVFLAGLLFRMLAYVAVLAIIAVPVAILIGLIVGFEKLRERRTSLVGLKLATGRHYAPSHTWLARRFGEIRIGLDDLARTILSGTTKVTLPVPGMRLQAGSPAVAIDCGNRSTMIPSPVTGWVTAVNTAVANDPGLLQSSPYRRGWLFTIDPDTNAWERFPKGEAAKAWFRAEGVRFSGHLEHELGLAAADGGELVHPAPALLTEEKWQALVSAFLR